MPSKYGNIQIQGSLDQLWKKSLQYWTNKRMKITNSQISENGLIRKIEFKSKPNMHLFAYSFGEKYCFQFVYQPQTRVTTIIMSCKYSMFAGRGFIWKVPQKTINEWVKYMGLPHIELSNEPNSVLWDKYCPNCGVILS